MVYEILRCTEERRNKTQIDPTCQGSHCETVDPECAEKHEIDRWIYKKKIALYAINNVVDLSKESDKQTIENSV